MKHRVGEMVGGVVEGMPWLGTFHSIGVKILRRHAELVGLKPDFTILDVDDQIRLIKQLLAAENIDEKRWPGARAGGADRRLEEPRPDARPGAVRRGRGVRQRQGARSSTGPIQERLKILNAADFGDLLLESIRLFREQPEVLRQYQERFKFILVDEYQDTNVAQYLWLRLLAQRRHSASRQRPGLVLRDAARRAAPQDEVGCRRDPLTLRRRDSAVSNGEIDAPPPRTAQKHLLRRRRRPVDLRLARGRGRQHPALRARLSRRQGDPAGAQLPLDRPHPRRRLAPDRPQRGPARQDAAHRGRAGREGRRHRRLGLRGGSAHRRRGDRAAAARSGTALNEIAILVRASFQMREFEDRFVTLGLPYRVIGGPRFYERAEIRDALAYLRVVNSPADDLAFERIVNVPKRGLGDATIKLLHDHARKRRVPLTEAARAMVETDELKPKPRGALRGLLELVRALAQAARYAAAHRTRRNRARRVRLHRDVAEGPLRRRRRPARKPQGAGALHGGIREPARLPRTHLAGDGRRQGRRRGRRLHHDDAFRQGARIRHRVPARLGGRPVPAASARSTTRAAPGWKRSAGSPMSA